MPSALKSKICWNCDGTLEVDESRCHFCGTSQEQIDSVSSGDRVVPLPLDPLQEALQKIPLIENKPFLDRFSETELLLITLISTMVGGTFLLFSLALFLFSKDGYLTLSWNAAFWPLFALLSAVLLYTSYKASSRF